MPVAELDYAIASADQDIAVFEPKMPLALQANGIVD
jgi:hypothetical protein